MIDAARRHGVARFVLASSVWAMRGAWDRGSRVLTAGAAEPSDSAYSRSKALAESVVADGAGDGLSVVVLRIGGRPPGDAPPVRLDDWEDSCWLGWHDFVNGIDRALDAELPVSSAGVATVTLVSNNPTGRWSLAEGRELIGYDPVQHYEPRRTPGIARRLVRRMFGT